MTYQKMKPCPFCGQTDKLGVFTYYSGWRHVECVRCNYLGPGEGRIGQAIKSHNAGRDERARAYREAMDAGLSARQIQKE